MMDAQKTIKTISYITFVITAIYLVLRILDLDPAWISLICLIGYIAIDCVIIAYDAAEKKKNKNQTEEQ